MRSRLFRASILFAATLGGCADYNSGDAGESSETEAPAQAQVQALDRDLDVGDVGDDVRALHAFLADHGYLPSARLARLYPSWRPLVAQGPAMDEVFDEQTAEAVRVFQSKVGIPASGVVDEETRTVLRRDVCGTPEGLPEFDGSEKFSLLPTNWGTKTSFTWRLVNTNDVTMTEARTAIYNAFQSWKAQTDITVTEMGAGVADIMITFGAIDGAGNKLAETYHPTNGDMTIDTAETWSVAAVTPAGAKDLQTVVLHELGHALAVGHSSVNSATMYPFVSSNDRTLHVDDKVAVSLVSDIPAVLAGNGVASDIAVSPDGQHVWIVTLTANGANYTIRKYNFATSSWENAVGGARHIAVQPDGTPWIVNAANQIFRGTTNLAGTVTWSQRPGLARDISIGANGEVWIITNTPAGAIAGNYSVAKWDTATNNWVTADGGGAGTRLAVAPTGRPWILNSSNLVYRRNTNAVTGGSWALLAGQMHHIAFDASGYAWGAEVAAAPAGGKYISVFNENAEILYADGTTASPYKKEWTRMVKGAGMVVAGGAAGPWLVDNAGRVLRSTK